MAYVSQALKLKVQEIIKEYCKKNNITLHFTIAVESSDNRISLNIQKCSIDLVSNCIERMESKVKNQADLPLNLIRTNRLHLMASDLAFNKEYRHDFEKSKSLRFCQKNLTSYFSGKALRLMEAICNALMIDWKLNDDNTRPTLVPYYYKCYIGNSKVGFTNSY